MPSIKEVARAAGVSITTVSLVLNNKGNISAETRERVLQVVEQLSYTRSMNARNLRDNQARIIGYAWDGKRADFNPVLDTFLYQMMRLTEEDGRHLLLFNSETTDPIPTYRALMESKRIDGFVLSHTIRNDERFAYLLENDFPFVAFGRSLSDLDELVHWVDVDGEAGTYIATEHLIEQGHQHIAFIGWPQGSASGDARYEGYLNALGQYGLRTTPAWVLRSQNDVNSGYLCGKNLIAQSQLPTAVICVSDVIALGAMRYFTEIGQRLAVTGFDDTPISEFAYPPLTSVRQPVERVAQILVEMLLAQLNDVPIEVKHHLLKPELIIRASSTLNSV